MANEIKEIMELITNENNVAIVKEKLEQLDEAFRIFKPGMTPT